MKVLIQVQINQGRWFSKSSGNNEQMCYRRAEQYCRSDGRRYRLIDADTKQVLDIINP